MDTKTIGLLLAAIIIGVAVGYAVSLPEKQALQSQLEELKQASQQVTELQSQIQQLQSQVQQLQKENEDLKNKLNPNLVEKIKARGKLIVGTSADWPPFEYIKDGKVVGIDIEIAKKIAEALGVELEIKHMKFAALIEAVKNGIIDMAIADITPTAEREKVVDFSVIYYSSKGNVVVTLADKNISNMDDLKGLTVGVQLGTIQEDWAKENLEKTGIAKVVSYNKVYPDMVMVLQRGDVDALVLSEMVANVILKKVSGLKIAFMIKGNALGSAVALPPGAEDLKYYVNNVIQDLIESGEMDKIFEEQIAAWLAGS